MRIGTRFVIGNLIIFSGVFILSLFWLTNEIEPEYRKSVEEPMVDASRILASLAASTSKNGKPDIDAYRKAFDEMKSASFNARIYDHIKNTVDFRVYITDENGIVLFDSNVPENMGKDFTIWRDVELTLAGHYGARTTRDNPAIQQSSVMYVASPIVLDGKIIGVLSLGKPTETSNIFVRNAQRNLIIGGAIVFLLICTMTYALSQRVVGPIAMLTGYARAIRDGKSTRLPRLANDETSVLGQAFEEMRGALDGKIYVERYLQAFTHEVKSPLSAIKGALELLKEDIPDEQRERFIRNMEAEVKRIQEISEKLLLLSSLESRKTLDIQEGVNCRDIVEGALSSMKQMIEGKDIEVVFDMESDCVISADPFWATHCLINILRNSVEFTPSGKRIFIAAARDSLNNLIISLRDEGPGVPDYALSKVQERFFSLRRPDSGQKSTGLGLSIVSEVMQLHGGSFRLENHKDGGTLASLCFPA